MQFMLIMNSPRDGYAQYLDWPEKIRAANVAFMRDVTRRLAESGELVLTEGLASPTQARRVRAGADGRPVTDGVFPESKEFLAGWWIVDVADAERAYAIAAEVSAAPGLPTRGEAHFWIEVRQVMSCHKDMTA